MSILSIDTDNTSSTIIDDDLSMTISDSSNTTSTSWHSINSDTQMNNNLVTQTHSIHIWLGLCSIEPDIRLTTAQEWKLRTCMRRLLSFCSVPLKISCLKIEQSISYTDQVDNNKRKKNANSSHSFFSLIKDKQLDQLGLYLHPLNLIDANNNLLEVKLLEFYFNELKNAKHSIPIQLIKSPRFVFDIFLTTLQLNLRTNSSLLQIHFSTRVNAPIRGDYYQWNESKSQFRKYYVTPEIDHSLAKIFQTF